jgi:predicted lipid-binding transport protein (Tim44 family)
MDNRVRELAGKIRSGIQAAARDRPQETKWSIAGAVTGLLFGLFFGGVGVAAFGGAIGLYGFIVFPLLFGIIGNRYGIGRDRKALVNGRRQ